MYFEKLKQMIIEELGKPEEKVTLEARLSEDLGIDSLDAVEIIMFIEDEYNVEVSDEDAFALKTVQDLVNYMEKLAK